MKNTRHNRQIQKKFTIDDSIEAFRENFIKTEMDIGGSQRFIHRERSIHRDNFKYNIIEKRVKGSYYRNFSAHFFNIYCFQPNDNEINTVYILLYILYVYIYIYRKYLY